MVVLFNAEQDPARPLKFMCRSQNATVFRETKAMVRVAQVPIPVCRWVPYIAVCEVMDEMLEFGLIQPTLGEHMATVFCHIATWH